ncbi:hypothetical protein M8J77_006991, partial [Diaphorina citri]
MGLNLKPKAENTQLDNDVNEKNHKDYPVIRSISVQQAT